MKDQTDQTGEQAPVEEPVEHPAPADQTEQASDGEREIVQPAGTQAATVAQPAQPDYAGPGVLHQDGSVAPVQGEAPNIGGSEHVQ